MSLKDDMEALQRHIDAGTAREFMAGTALTLPLPKWSDETDLSAARVERDTYRFIVKRGD